MTTLLFLTVCYLSAVVAWLVDRRWPWQDTPAVVAAGVIWGLATGMLVSAWAGA